MAISTPKAVSSSPDFRNLTGDNGLSLTISWKFQDMVIPESLEFKIWSPVVA
jgi:hypothetical protein